MDELDTYICNNIIQVIKSAYREHLAMSFKHCHALNVHSVVVNKHNNYLERYFIAENGHGLWRNFPGSPAYAVGPHDHKYNVSITQMSSNVINYTYKENEVGERFKKYKVESGLDKNKAALFKHVSSCQLLCVKTDRRYVDIKSDTIHTMYAPFYKTAFWKVEEYYDKPKAATNLYSNCLELDKNGHLNYQSELYKKPPDIEEFRNEMINILKGAINGN